MILELLKPNHPMLRMKLDPFDFNNPPVDPFELSNNLIETMVHNKGLGLSANQCGLPYRVFVMWSSPTKICFNPRLVDQTSEEVLLDEGCLSYPNLLVKIKRSKVIKVRYQDEMGKVQNEKFIGMTARCFLHELDHMDGIVYTSRANPIHLNRARNQQKLVEREIKRNK